MLIELERDIKFQTADLRKKYRIKLPDAIIAATSIVYDLTLITSDTKDFMRIEEAKLLDTNNL